MQNDETYCTGLQMLYKHPSSHLTIPVFPFPIGTMCHLSVIFVVLLAGSAVMVNGNSPPTLYHNQLWVAINNTYTDLMCSFGYVPFATYPTTSLRHCLGLATAKLASAVIRCYDSSAANQANQGVCSLWETGHVSNWTHVLQSLGLTGNPKCMTINSMNLGQWPKQHCSYIFHNILQCTL